MDNLYNTEPDSSQDEIRLLRLVFVIKSLYVSESHREWMLRACASLKAVLQLAISDTK